MINKYSGFTITNDNTFHIIESSSKIESHDSAIQTLRKIEFIVKNQLLYDGRHESYYSNLSKDDLFISIKEKSSQIHQGYKEKPGPSDKKDLPF